MAVQSSIRTDSDNVTPEMARAERALELFQERGHLIRSVASDTFEVPSCGVLGKRYTVRYGGLEESCDCPDWQFGHGRPCKHLLCVGIAHAARRSGVVLKQSFATVAGDGFAYAAKRRAVTAACAGCGHRFRRGELVEVQESLTYFAGDLLCAECWHGSDAVVL